MHYKKCRGKLQMEHNDLREVIQKILSWCILMNNLSCNAGRLLIGNRKNQKVKRPALTPAPYLLTH
jgi:hypothetical protein